MHINERPTAFVICNMSSGKQEMTPHTCETFGLPVVPFLEFIQRPKDFITPDIQKIIVAGGDGTFFSIAQILAEIMPETAVISLLALGIGTENVASQVAGTLKQPKRRLVADFLFDKLTNKPLNPFEYTTPEGTEGLAFWSVGVGGIPVGILEQIQKLRSIKDPTTRRALATFWALLEEHKNPLITAKRHGGSRIVGRHLGFVREGFPLWPKFFNVEQNCPISPSVPHDYVVRYGKEGQGATESIAGVALDLLACRLLHRSVTNTVYVEPVTEPILEMGVPQQVVAIDSELYQQRIPGNVVIRRNPNKLRSRLFLACSSAK